MRRREGWNIWGGREKGVGLFRIGRIKVTLIRVSWIRVRVKGVNWFNVGFGGVI